MAYSWIGVSGALGHPPESEYAHILVICECVSKNANCAAAIEKINYMEM